MYINVGLKNPIKFLLYLTSKSLYNNKMLPPYFYVTAVFLPIWLVLCGTHYSDARERDRSDATSEASSEGLPPAAYGASRPASLVVCPEKQRQIVRGYTYNFTIFQGTGSAEINFAFSQAVAYHLTVQQKIVSRNARHFNLTGFPDAYNISFPPQTVFSCYSTVVNWAMQNISSLSTQLEQIYKLPIPSSLNMTLEYFTQRNEMYQRVELYRKAHHDTVSLQTFTANCEYSEFKKITDLINNLITDDPFQTLTPTFNRTALYASVKMLISDIIIYEIIQQACKGVGYSEVKVTQNDWDAIAAKLRQADAKITSSWRTHLKKDVTNFKLTTSDTSDLSFVGKFHKSLSDTLTEKYFWNVFRVHLYHDLPGKTVNAICEGAERTQCVRRNDTFAVVTWKEMNLDEAYVVGSNASAHVHNVTTPERSGVANGSPAYLKPKLAATADLITKVTQPLDDLTSNNRLSSIKHVADTGEKLARWTVGVGSTLKKMLNIANTFAKFAGPLASSVCAVLSVFEENHIPKILAEMNAKFAEMHGRFDKLENQMQSIKTDIINEVKQESALQISYTAYQRDVTGRISRLRAGFREYQNTNKAPIFQVQAAATYLNPLKTLVDLCKSPNKPYTIVQLMHETFVENIEFKKNILFWSQTHRLSLQTFLMYRVQEVAALQMYSLECSLYRYAYLLAVGGSWQNNDIMYELSLLEGGQAMAFEELTDIRYAILKLDNEQLYGWQPHLRARLIGKYPTVNNIQDAAAIARQLKTDFIWNDFSVAVFKARNPSWNIPGLAENIFFKSFFINPDYSELIVVPGSSGQPNAYIIVNWGLSEEKLPDSGSLIISGSTGVICALKSNQYIHHLQGRGLKSLFIWRTYVGAATHMAYHQAGKHADVRALRSSNIQMEHDSCCGFGGSLRIAQDERHCWHKSVGALSTECFVISGPYCHRDHAIIVKVVGNFGEGY